MSDKYTDQNRRVRFKVGGIWHDIRLQDPNKTWCGRAVEPHAELASGAVRERDIFCAACGNAVWMYPPEEDEF